MNSSSASEIALSADQEVFSKMKKELSGRHFDSDDNAIATVDPELEVQTSIKKGFMPSSTAGRIRNVEK